MQKETGDKVNGKFTIRERRNGVWKVASRFTYVDSILHGPYVKYKSDHITVGNYYQGKKHGTIKRLSKYGKFQSSKIYLYGNRVPASKSYDVVFPIDVMYLIIDFYMCDLHLRISCKSEKKLSRRVKNRFLREVRLNVNSELLKGLHSLHFLNKQIHNYMQKYDRKKYLFVKSCDSFTERWTILREYNLNPNGTLQGRYRFVDFKKNQYLEFSHYENGYRHGEATIYDTFSHTYSSGTFKFGYKEGTFKVFSLKMEPNKRIFYSNLIGYSFTSLDLLRYEEYKNNVLISWIEINH